MNRLKILHIGLSLSISFLYSLRTSWKV